MRYRNLLVPLGVLLIGLGLFEKGWLLIGVWLGADFLVLGIAHGKGLHGIFGKRADGSLPVWSWMLYFPLLVYTYVVWHLIRIFSKEPAYNEVSPELVVGRRLLKPDLNQTFENYVDLTSEFSEPALIRTSPAYRNFSILDGAAPTPEQLDAAVSSLRQGRTYVHCAQGHGRTGLFALAILLKSKRAKCIEDGLHSLQSVRPGIRLNQDQIKCVQIFSEKLTTGVKQQ